MSKIKYLVILLCSIVSLSFNLLVYKVANASPIDWLLGTHEVTVTLPEKTLDSEIDRLSTEYDVSPVDTQILRNIIKCESQENGDAIHYNKDNQGNILSTDISYFQINDYYHEKTMKDLGLDIHNQADSLKYGFILFKSEGTSPWKASKQCWSSKIK